MNFHPVANIFPMMSAEEFEALKADIQANGQLEPIWLHDNQIVDGRNRYNACVALGVEPAFREWNGEGSLVAFVISLNLVRRHLNETQRGMVAARLANMPAHRPSNKSANLQTSQSRAAELLNVSPRTVAAAVKVMDAEPEIVALCDAGKLAASTAKQVVNKAPEFQRRVAEAINSGKVKSGPEAIKVAKFDTAQSERLKAAEGKPLHDDIIVGDFWTNADKIADGSLSLIFTDPPYSKAAESLLPHLADFAASKLAPGGSLLFYVGTLQLPAAFEAFKDKLRYWWTCACVHAGNTSVLNYYGVRWGWKPMLWFVKETRFDINNIVMDTVSSGTEKQFHEWQQGEDEARYWIEKLCPVDGIVCDPFLGSGTTAAAANKLNRKWVGFEIDPDTARIASGRLQGKEAALAQSA